MSTGATGRVLILCAKIKNDFEFEFKRNESN